MKLTKAERAAAAQASPSYALQPGPRAGHLLRKEAPHVARRHDVFLYNGRTLVQPRLPALVGQYGLTVPRANEAAPPLSDADRAAQDFAEGASDGPDIMRIGDTPPPLPGQHSRKRAAQWQRWQQEVIPSVLPHYATLLYESKSLRDLDGRNPTPSSCGCQMKHLRVAIVHFSSIEDVELNVCKCRTAAVQLMQLGAFGCAPIAPSLAVDLRVLEFTTNLFLQISPNNSAFTIALERVLANMGFQLTHQDSLRRRFGNCLMWYTYLRGRLKTHYSSIIEGVRTRLILEAREPEADTPPPSPTAAAPPRGRQPARSTVRSGASSTTPTPRSPRRRESPRASSSPATPPPAPRTRKRPRTPSPETPQVPFPEPPPRQRPSEYLRRRCPACFGYVEHDPSEVADVVACLDACFTQKKKKSPRDPPRFHPNTRFIAEDLAAQTEAYVDSVRKTGRKDKKRVHRVVEEQDDEYEHAKLPLPRSVLDGCEASFKAADEKREKASTEFFEDTALMALVCRHDRVLWVVNMHTAGEKQFNVLLLVETLFQHLPCNIRVGLLYDIACTLERSCWKWGFLSRYMDRIAFAVSVFHAFGHEWACQLLYHPRKRIGFGFSNGEGCERFWKSISHLIAHLRICGYHNRLYTLDAQIEHAEESSLLRLGEWIRRRNAHSVQKRAEATEAFRACGHPKSLLREEWKKQVIAQTKPLARRNKNAGEKAVAAVMLLRAAVETRKVQIRDLRKQFLDAVDRGDDANSTLLQMEYVEAEHAQSKAEESLRRKEAALGVDEHEELTKLANSEYMRHRMNARALKLRLRERLRARKFEMDVVERAYRRLMNDAKLHAHTESAVKRREPTIAKVAAEYNKLCASIAKLIRDGKAPRNAIAPIPIPAKGLWQLDVDDTIFQDVGLGDNDENDDYGAEPPLWLCDDNVRNGIKALLELDRCDEEDARLRREARSLRMWFAEEWSMTTTAIVERESEIDKYHLKLHEDKLVGLCATWNKHLPAFREQSLPAWGPSAAQLSSYNVDAHLAARGEDRHYGEQEVESEDDDGMESGGEEDDFGTLEAVGRADVYRTDY
ncbi:hypothetical protein DFH06DRAFT_968141 [Mycena polygramma]|nr:hypothetical protein DFH06DRAFT_968141 [Mycena polygramma]